MTYKSEYQLNVHDQELLDSECRYKVLSQNAGVAWRLVGFEECPDEDYEWTGIMRYNTDCVIMVMVGDDERHRVDRDDIEPIADEDYCHECGQIGCTHDGR